MTTTTDAEVAPLSLHPLDANDRESVPLPRGEPVVVGRSRRATVCLPDLRISRIHASIEPHARGWTLTDQGGSAGTYLNWIRLEPGEPAFLASGDVVRIGPYSFRVGAEGEHATIMPSRAVVTPTAVVERATHDDLDTLAARRLSLLMEGAVALHAAESEETLARVLVDLAVQGTGFGRGAVLRLVGSVDEMEVVAHRDDRNPDAAGFEYSRSLVAEALAGHPVRLVEEAVTDIAQSISDLGIRSAVCAPLTLGDAVTGVVYLDARLGEGAALPEALGFCDALARLAALSLGEIKRAELHKRQLQLEADLGAAQIAQRFLGPAATGRIGPVTYATRTFPGRLVAGDLFDIFPLPGGRAGICVGDVTGQGFAAGIVMTAVLSHLRASLARAADPADAVALANRYLTERSETGVFTTLFAAVLDADGTLHFADAGHGHWILARADGSVTRGPLPDALVIGVEPSAEYAARTLTLAAGDRVVLYSDGMVEHLDVDSAEFGFERLAGSLEGSGGPQEDVDRAFSALEAFLDGRPLSDDTTIASLRYEGP